MLDRMDSLHDASPALTANSHDIWLVYDGQCPYSRLASRIIRIQTKWGRLVLLDARLRLNHPLVRDLSRLGLDINQGLVVRFNNRFYHAREALQLLASLEAPTDPFNWLHARLLRSHTMAGVTAAAIGVLRSFYLWISGKPGIRLPQSLEA